MKGDKPDEHIREPLVWAPHKTAEQTTWIESKYDEAGGSVEEQNEERNSLLNHYRNLSHLRQTNDVLMKGDIKPIETNNEHILAFERSYENQSNIVLHNLSEQPVSVSLEDVDVKKVLYETNKVKIKKAHKQITLTIPAQSSVIVESPFVAPFNRGIFYSVLVQKLQDNCNQSLNFGHTDTIT
ncbi:alpha-glucosidase C-terminal domain-containing protein [Bacillus songklensis]|uniref:Alpha-glucosidase C-terminal domain-containing protein n=1 Tax=Bacillus songklensis TaxID=1069116 RepID=A0ABV8B2P6_9BACI